MTDNEIITAYEDKVNLIGSMTGVYLEEEGGLDLYEVMLNVLDLINRQKEEINALNGNTEKYIAECEKRSREIAEDYRKEIKSEVIKDFAERLKERFYSLEYKADTKRTTLPIDFVKDQMEWIFKCVCTETIDNLLKEITESEDT